MGTNFYWRDPVDITDRTGAPWEPDLSQDDPRIHIGKRSAAGLYCWDCDVTLCKGGNDAIHHGISDWHDRCPRCGASKSPNEARVMVSSSAVELGFAKPATKRKTGVCGAASFSWAQDPERVGAICEQSADTPIIEDEYGTVLTGKGFLVMLRSNCPIQFTDSIGSRFC